MLPKPKTIGGLFAGDGSALGWSLSDHGFPAPRGRFYNRPRSYLAVPNPPPLLLRSPLRLDDELNGRLVYEVGAQLIANRNRCQGHPEESRGG